jgi:hypothetical protein
MTTSRRDRLATPVTPSVGPLRSLDEPGGSWLARDLRRLRRLAQIAYAYWTAGSRLRRAYRKAETEGTTLWLDER